MQSQTQNSSKEISEFCFKIGQLQSLMEKEDNITSLFLQQCLDNQELNKSLGCMFGAFMGDALGSYCQFKLSISNQLLAKTMEMPGKGTFQVRPGQFTDDSELAAHLLEGLSSYNFDNEFQVEKDKALFNIAKSYTKWYNSEPYDIGMTTRCAFSIIKSQLFNLKCSQQQIDKQNIEYQQFLKTIFQKINTTNNNSQSNGSLMRITPMAFFVTLIKGKKQCKEFQKFIEDQINMTHGRQIMKKAGSIWVELLVEIIERNKNKKTLKQIITAFISTYENNNDVKQWVEQAKLEEYMPAHQNMGWAKIAWSFGIKKLKLLSEIDEKDLNQKHYIQHISDVIQRAGDTDTNGAIVGGLIGAVLGFKNLPRNYLQKQFSLRLNGKPDCQYRSEQYEPRYQLVTALKMIKKSKYLIPK